MALVLAIVSLFIGPLSIVSLVLGIVTYDHPKGAAALWVSMLSLIGWILVLLLLKPWAVF